MLFALLLAATAAAEPAAPSRTDPPPPSAELPRSGLFGVGVGLQPLSLGMVQAVGAGDSAVGINLVTAIQIDLGPRWALRIPLEISYGGADKHAFTEVGFTPGAIYRWRSHPDQALVPYVGGGFKLGAVVAYRGLLGLPIRGTSTSALGQGLDARTQLQFDWHDFDSSDNSSGDPDAEGRVGLFPELWAGLEWHPARILAFDLGVAYGFVRLVGTNIHVLHERLGARLTF